MKIGAVIQARAGSTRLPNKVFKNVGESIIVQRIVKSLRACENIDAIVMAVPYKDKIVFDDVFLYGSGKLFWYYDIGDENDVMNRLIEAANLFCLDAVVRVCADSPFILSWLVDYAIDYFNSTNVEYLKTECFPKGQNIEIITLDALKKSYKDSNDEEKEHVTLHIERNPDKFITDILKVDLVVDTQEDLERVNKIAKYYDRNK